MSDEEKKIKFDVYPSKYEELDRIVELIQEFDYPFGREHFEWKYFDCPWGSVSVSAKKKDKIIGQLGYIIRPYIISGKQVLLCLSADAIVKRDLRKMGIYTGLHTMARDEALEKKVKYNIAFPNKNTYRAGQKAGYKNMGWIPVYLKALNMKNVLNSTGKTGLAPFAGIAKKVMFRDKKPKISESFKVTEVKTVPKDLDRLWADILADPDRKFENIGLRTKEFLEWRFFKCPDRDYKFVVAKDENNNLRGYIILVEASVEVLTEGVIVDIFHKPNDKETCLALISYATNVFTKAGLDIIGFLWSDTSSCIPDCLRSFGYGRFVKRFNPRPWPVFLRDTNLKPIPPKVLNPKNWFLSWADCDVF
jgi:hypothetical protein